MWKGGCTAFMASPHQMSVSTHLQAIAALPPAKQSALPTDPFTSTLLVMEHVRMLGNFSSAATKLPVYTAI